MTEQDRNRPLVKNVADWIEKHHPQCEAAILGGSTVTGDANALSDLDVVIIDPEADVSYRETHEYGSRTIETFVFRGEEYRQLFAENARLALPTLQRICAEGVILINRHQAADRLRDEALHSLRQGPDPWTLDEMNNRRYELTDMLDDLEAGRSPLEEWTLFHRLAWMAMEFVLRVRDRWCGEGKWMARELNRCDQALYDRLAAAVESYATDRDKSMLIAWVDEVLEPYGGRLSAGFVQERQDRNHYST